MIESRIPSQFPVADPLTVVHDDDRFRRDPIRFPDDFDASFPVLHQPRENLFLIDWLTVVFHRLSCDEVKDLLQLEHGEWQHNLKFHNGYPREAAFGNIVIWYGAEDPENYTGYVRRDGSYRSPEDACNPEMGVCLNLSGQACRQFEECSRLTWMEFICQIVKRDDRCSITRLDLAYDDHSGILPLWRIHNDIKDRNFIGPAKKTRIIWSDDMSFDIQGLTCEIGSNKSELLIRIYDKAAERGFDRSRSWVRVELQLRRDRATSALRELYKLSVNHHKLNDHRVSAESHDMDYGLGMLVSGIIRNYCMFVEPSGTDSNKSRWPVAEYWQRMLCSMEKIVLWEAPGEPYNFSKSEEHLVRQYSQMLVCFSRMHRGSLSDLLKAAEHYAPRLSQKYLRVLDLFHAQEAAKKLSVEKAEALIAELNESQGFAPPSIGDFGEFDPYAAELVAFRQQCLADYEANPFPTPQKTPILLR